MLKRTPLLAIYFSILSILSSYELHARYPCPPCWQQPRQPCQIKERFWIDTEYMYWKIKDTPLNVPLLVEGPIPSSKTVLGGKNLANEWRSGGKVSLGYWLDNTQRLGGEVSYALLPNCSTNKIVSSDGSLESPILSVPFYNTLTGLRDFSSVSLPGTFEGTAKLKLKNSMQSAELNVIATLPIDATWNIVFLAGMRYWSFYESLTFTTNSPFIPPAPIDIYQTKDHFLAQNNFYGGQVGGTLNYMCNNFFTSLQAKLALGTMHQKSEIKGYLQTNDFNGFGEAQKFPGGYFTVPSNIRDRKNDPFAIIPEAHLKMGYQYENGSYMQIGYSVMFANNVLWSGKEVNQKINPSQSATLTNSPTPVLVGEPSPKGSISSSNFWVHGVTAGIKVCF